MTVIWRSEAANTATAACLAASGAEMGRVDAIDGTTSEDGQAFDPGGDRALLEAAAEAVPAPSPLILDLVVSAVAGGWHKGERRRARAGTPEKWPAAAPDG